MNNVVLIGRLTKDPELKQGNIAVCKFNLAINRGKNNKGEDMGADFPRVTVFGKQAENANKYLAKGRLVAVQGRIQTGSYNDKEGKTVYTFDVVADRVEYLEWGDTKEATTEITEEVPY